MESTLEQYGNNWATIEDIVNQGYYIGMIQDWIEITKYAEFLSDAKPKNVMEIGAHKGGTFFILSHYSTGIKIMLDLPEVLSPELDMTNRNNFFTELGPNTHIVEMDSHSKEADAEIGGILNL